MKRSLEPPVRLVHQCVDKCTDPLAPTLAEAQASVHAAAAAAPVLSEGARHRIRRRLQSSVASERSPRARLWVAMAFGVCMLVSGAVGATVGSVVTSWLEHDRAIKREVEGQRQRPGQRRTPRPARATLPPPAPEALPVPEQPQSPAAGAHPRARNEARSEGQRPMPPTAPLPAAPRAPQQMLHSPRGDVRPSLPTPSLAQAPSSLASQVVSPPAQPEPSLAGGPLATTEPSQAGRLGTMAEPSQAAPVSGSLRREPRSASAALGARPAPAVVAQASPGRDEAAMLSDAIRLLRVQGNARAALALIDGGGSALTAGAFGPEVAALRIEVLLVLGQSREALDDLERLAVATLPRATEWLVVRAELRGKAGRWSAAEVDFAAALAAPRLNPQLEERASWGRIVARLHLGNAGGARADAQEYLRRFPRGRFRLEAAKAAAAP